MSLGANIWPDLANCAVGTDQNGGADQTLVSPAIVLLFSPNAKRADGLVLGIRQQDGRERIFLPEIG